jgi:hypothetical protein
MTNAHVVSGAVFMLFFLQPTRLAPWPVHPGKHKCSGVIIECARDRPRPVGADALKPPPPAPKDGVRERRSLHLSPKGYAIRHHGLFSSRNDRPIPIGHRYTFRLMRPSTRNSGGPLEHQRRGSGPSTRSSCQNQVATKARVRHSECYRKNRLRQLRQYGQLRARNRNRW